MNPRYIRIPAHLPRVPELITGTDFGELVYDFASRALADPAYEARSAAYCRLRGEESEAIVLPAPQGLVDHGLALSLLLKRIEQMDGRQSVAMFVSRSEEQHLVVGALHHDCFELRDHRPALKGERAQIGDDSLRIAIARIVAETLTSAVHQVGVDPDEKQLTIEYIGAHPDTRSQDAILRLCKGWSVVFTPVDRDYAQVRAEMDRNDEYVDALQGKSALLLKMLEGWSGEAAVTAPDEPAPPHGAGTRPVPAAVFIGAPVPDEAAGPGTPVQAAPEHESVDNAEASAEAAEPEEPEAPAEPAPPEEPKGERPGSDTPEGQALDLLEETGKTMRLGLIAHELGIKGAKAVDALGKRLRKLVNDGWLMRPHHGWYRARYPRNAAPAPAEGELKGKTYTAQAVEVLEKAGCEMHRDDIAKALRTEKVNSLNEMLRKMVKDGRLKRPRKDWYIHPDHASRERNFALRP